VITEIVDNFLSKEEIKFLLKYYKERQLTVFRYMGSYPLELNKKDEKLSFLMNKLNNKSKQMKESEIDWFQIVKWPPSNGQRLHFDLHSSRTTLSSIVYLNNDFEGGETYFEDGTIFKPKPGRALYFDGNYHKHGVKPINKGTRYTVATWYYKK
jgi:hypothetical protein